MTPNDRPPNIKGDFILGLLLGIILHVAFAILWGVIATILSFTPYFNRNYQFLFLGIPIFFLGITQVIYLLPAYIVARKKGRTEIGKGIVTCAIVTVLLNGACFTSISYLPALGIMILSLPVIAIVSALIANHFTK